MLTCIPGATRIGYHLPYVAVPTELSGLPVLGTIRNPLAYYVSWFHFQRGLAAHQRNALFEVVSAGDTLDFGQTVERLVTLGERPELIRALRERLPDRFEGHGANITKTCIDPLSGTKSGFYTFLHDRMYAGARDVTIIPLEGLRDRLAVFLDAHHPESRDRWLDFLQRAPAMNRSNHDAYQTYYPPALAKLVAARDGGLLDRYG